MYRIFQITFKWNIYILFTKIHHVDNTINAKYVNYYKFDNTMQKEVIKFCDCNVIYLTL